MGLSIDGNVVHGIAKSGQAFVPADKLKSQIEDLKSQVDSLQNWKNVATASVNNYTYWKQGEDAPYTVTLHMNDGGTISEI